MIVRVASPLVLLSLLLAVINSCVEGKKAADTIPSRGEPGEGGVTERTGKFSENAEADMKIMYVPAFSAEIIMIVPLRTHSLYARKEINSVLTRVKAFLKT